MRLDRAARRRWRRAAIIGFVVPTLVLFVYLWVKTGGGIPGVTGRGYKIVAMVPDDAANPGGIQNLVVQSKVKIAGVPVGTVTGLHIRGDEVAVDITFTQYQPLHRGVRIRIRPKNLMNPTYIQVIDGNGPPLPSGSVLPASVLESSVTLQDVLNSLQPQTRAVLGELVRELNQATAGQGGNLSGILAGLGQVGRQGTNTLDVLAAQNQDLQQIVKGASVLMNALDTGNGQIAQLAESADEVTQATARTASALSRTMAGLPGLIGELHQASPSIERLASALNPVVADLSASAKNLDASLQTLPSITQSLDATMGPLGTDLSLAPATLSQVPTTATDLDALVPSLTTALANVDPMLGYLEPYGHAIASFFTNMGQSLAGHDANGDYLRAFLVLNLDSVKAYPVNTSLSPLLHTLLGTAVPEANPYPSPTEPLHPTGFSGTYPRIYPLSAG
jgi:phospholipid/cholesterol/gamma-HCH transport system substrate-binding protein